MTLEEFNTLPVERRTGLYLRFPAFIAAIESTKNIYLLYTYKHIHVEVIFSNGLELQNITSITAADAAQKYGIPPDQLQGAICRV